MAVVFEKNVAAEMFQSVKHEIRKSDYRIGTQSDCSHPPSREISRKKFIQLFRFLPLAHIFAHAAVRPDPEAAARHRRQVS